MWVVAQKCLSIFGEIFAAPANDAVMLDFLLLRCVVTYGPTISVQGPSMEQFTIFVIATVAADFDFHISTFKVGLLFEIIVGHRFDVLLLRRKVSINLIHLKVAIGASRQQGFGSRKEAVQSLRLQMFGK